MKQKPHFPVKKWWKGFLLKYPYSKGVLAGRTFKAAVFNISLATWKFYVLLKFKKNKNKKIKLKKPQTNQKTLNQNKTKLNKQTKKPPKRN